MHQKITSSIVAKQYLLFLALGISVLILAFFLSFRLISRVWYKPFPIPRETNVENIQEWMTISYISKAYGVPQDIFLDSLDFKKYPKVTIRDISKQKSIPTQELIIEIKKIIVNFQDEHPIPPNVRQ